MRCPLSCMTNNTLLLRPSGVKAGPQDSPVTTFAFFHLTSAGQGLNVKDSIHSPFKMGLHSGLLTKQGFSYFLEAGMKQSDKGNLMEKGIITAPSSSYIMEGEPGHREPEAACHIRSTSREEKGTVWHLSFLSMGPAQDQSGTGFHTWSISSAHLLQSS